MEAAKAQNKLASLISSHCEEYTQFSLPRPEERLHSNFLFKVEMKRFTLLKSSYSLHPH